MNTVAARLQDLEGIVGAGFAGKDDDEETSEAVLQRLVLSVETSKDLQRIEALELFCRDYLQEFELSLYVGAPRVAPRGLLHGGVADLFNTDIRLYAQY